MRVARPPEQRPPRLPERVECPDEREVAQRLFLQSNALREIVERPERAPLALPDDRIRLRLTQSLHLDESEPDVMRAARAVGRDGDRPIDDDLVPGGAGARRAVTRGRRVF